MRLPMSVTDRRGERFAKALRAPAAALLLAASFATIGHAADHANLSVVKPVKSCADLAKTDFGNLAGTPASVTSAQLRDTAKGSFCEVIVHVAPTIMVTVNLPAEHWTQRYFQSGGGGGAPGPDGYPQAGSCTPALNGEFVVGGNNLPRHEMVGWPPAATPGPVTTYADWTDEPQKRIDIGYRANHVTALIAKALTSAYYGQAPRYAYYMGCSLGGGEALAEAERFPGDFDGVSSGAPTVLETAAESTYHLWIARANMRADGTNILMPAKLELVHDAVLAQCDTLSGLKDGLLQDPSSCHFKPVSLQCAAGVTDTRGCLTAEEVGALQNLYDGANDERGQPLLFGVNRGGETQWMLAETPTGEPPIAHAAALALAYFILPEYTPADSDYKKVTFTKAGFELASTLSPLYDATNTNLRPFAARGGKLILWHGLSDSVVPPGSTLAYYHGVQQFMGARAADKFVRMFLLPGVKHCGGGDGYDQLDLLSPLMAWTESNQAPTQIMTGKTAPSPAAPPSAIGGVPPKLGPYATPTPVLTATRPVYAYPSVAHYAGKGDPKDGANYVRAKNTPSSAVAVHYAALKLIGPDTLKEYGVKDGKLVAQP